jgi:hypothetical protein
MKHLSLGEFIATNRDEILRRCRVKAMVSATPSPKGANLDKGIPVFLDDVVDQLNGEAKSPATTNHAAQHGSDLFRKGLSVGQVVENYGAFCQAVTDLAVEVKAPISANDFRTLNQCLDDATASAVSEYSRHVRLDAEVNQSMTLQNLVETAITGFEALQTGKIAVGGATGDLVHRALQALRVIVSSTTKQVH